MYLKVYTRLDTFGGLLNQSSKCDSVSIMNINFKNM